MKPRTIKIVVSLFALCILATALRHDLSNWVVARGMARLQAGDVAGAAAAFQQAGMLGADAGMLAYNLGVGLYRQGEHSKAREQFTAAMATTATDLRAAAHYNRGNAGFRLGERLAASDRPSAARLFQEAIADYGKALALTPGDADAGANLAVARARLAALGNGQATDPRARSAETGNAQQPQSAAGNSQPRGSGGDATRPASSTQEAGAHPASAAAVQEMTPDAAKPRRELSLAEVERLLNEARGREKLAGLLQPDRRSARLAAPDRDW